MCSSTMFGMRLCPTPKGEMAEHDLIDGVGQTTMLSSQQPPCWRQRLRMTRITSLQPPRWTLTGTSMSVLAAIASSMTVRVQNS